MNRQQGLAMVLVLWMLTLLTIMAGSFALTMRRETAIIIGLKNNAQARAIAEAGIALAELMMLNNDPDLRWQTNGQIYEMNYAGARVRVRLLSEAGKIDINAADEAQLHILMHHAEIDEQKQQQIVNAILDWRDQDDLVRIDGAEKDEYLAAGLKYAPANRPFQSMAELQMVLGMDDSLFNWLEPFVTIYTKQKIDLQKASTELLKILDSSAAAFDAPVSMETEETSRQQSFPQNEFLEFSPIQNERQSVSLGTGEAVTIIAEARIAEDMKAILKTVVKRSQSGLQPFQILDWQTDPASHGSLFAADMDALLEAEYAGSRYDH
ncbi:MAG: general secretion pathway protein GspK [Gammaproteobacteria bacterium]